MKKHIVRSFDEQLDAVNQMVVSMGRLAEKQLGDATEALLKREPERCEAVLLADKTQDASLLQLENYVIDMLALRQPMAADLRASIAALRAARDIERIGDYAKNIAKHTVTLCRLDCGLAVDRFAGLIQAVAALLTETVTAYEHTDGALAARVRNQDAEVDRLHTAVFQSLLSDMESHAITPTVGAHLLFVARAIERIGDHATNVAEDVLFQVQGHLPTDERERGDMSPYSVGTA